MLFRAAVLIIYAVDWNELVSFLLFQREGKRQKFNRYSFEEEGRVREGGVE